MMSSPAMQKMRKLVWGNRLMPVRRQAITRPGDYSFNSSPSGQNGQHFADDIFKRIFLNEDFRISICISLRISQHWSRQWLGAEQATSEYLNQCWPSSLSHICGTRGRWVNEIWKYISKCRLKYIGHFVVGHSDMRQLSSAWLPHNTILTVDPCFKIF